MPLIDIQLVEAFFENDQKAPATAMNSNGQPVPGVTRVRADETRVLRRIIAENAPRAAALTTLATGGSNDVRAA